MSALVLVYNITVSGFELVLPLQGGTIGTVVWGDGNSDATNSHTYTNSGEYTVTVTGTGITNMDQTVGSATGAQYLTACTSFGEIGLTNLSSAFNGCTNLTTVPTSLPTTSTVTLTSYMFYGATSFNQNISGWDVSNVIDMGAMFYNATSFNQNISTWDVSAVTNMNIMFYGATSFNQNLGSWDISGIIDQITSMFSYTLSTANYNNILNGWSSLITLPESIIFFNLGLVYSPAGLTARTTMIDTYLWSMTGDAYLSTDILKTGDVFSLTINVNASFSYNANVLQLYYLESPFSSPETYYTSSTTITFTNLVFSTSGNLTLELRDNTFDTSIANYRFTVYSSTLVCFKEDSKILTNRGYKPIQHLRKGDLIQTLKDGFKPIYMIGKKEIHHQASQEDRIKDQLYVCTKENYPDIMEDLVITGCHSILVKSFKNDEQKEKAANLQNGTIYVTDDHYRLPACLDENALVYEPEGIYTIYHLALDHDNYYMNYGIYANGLLVESCTKNYLERLSGMTIIE